MKALRKLTIIDSKGIVQEEKAAVKSGENGEERKEKNEPPRKYLWYTASSDGILRLPVLS